jgi:hypothetical protein
MAVAALPFVPAADASYSEQVKLLIAQAAFIG